MKRGRCRRDPGGFLESRKIVHDTVMRLFKQDREYPSIRKIAKEGSLAIATVHARIAELAQARLVRLHSEGGHIVWAGHIPEYNQVRVPAPPKPEEITPF